MSTLENSQCACEKELRDELSHEQAAFQSVTLDLDQYEEWNAKILLEAEASDRARDRAEAALAGARAEVRFNVDEKRKDPRQKNAAVTYAEFRRAWVKRIPASEEFPRKIP